MEPAQRADSVAAASETALRISLRFLWRRRCDMSDMSDPSSLAVQMDERSLSGGAGKGYSEVGAMAGRR